MALNWNFADSPRTAVFTTQRVLDGAAILRVSHDYDGEWQFHGADDQPTTIDEARLVSLGSLLKLDPSLAALHDLEPGWQATRESVDDTWSVARNHSFPTFADDGYYLEDAVWMSQYRADVRPPEAEIRNNLPLGVYVKLLFRFAAENANRQDGEVERMWVQLTDIDDNYYIGTLENDPAHSAVLNYGAIIHFHPLHVMEILQEDDDGDDDQ